MITNFYYKIVVKSPQGVLSSYPYDTVAVRRTICVHSLEKTKQTSLGYIVNCLGSGEGGGVVVGGGGGGGGGGASNG